MTHSPRASGLTKTIVIMVKMVIMVVMVVRVVAGGCRPTSPPWTLKAYPYPLGPCRPTP